MILAWVGFGLPVVGAAGLVIGLAKKQKKIWIPSIVIPVLYWIGFYFLWQADQRYIQQETEKNGGQTPDWVW